MKVKIKRGHIGGLLITPVSEKAQKTISEFMKEMKGHPERTAYIGESQVRDVKEGILSFLSEEQWGEILSGYTVTVEGDPWDLLHLWGWDAHTLSENGAVR